MPASNEIYARVKKVLVQALGVEEEAITPSTTLQGDLGAESIDFLDIVFRLEREFMIRIPHVELLPVLVLQGDTGLVRDGQVTAKGLAVLRSQMPYADLMTLQHDRRLDRVYQAFTVDLLSRYIAWKFSRSDDSHGPVLASASSAAMRTLQYRS